MKVGVFFRNAPRELAETLLLTLRSSAVAATAYRIGHTWRDLDGNEINHHFAGITHIVLVPQAGDEHREFHGAWFAFLVGYALGRSVPVYLLADKELASPAFLSGLERIPDAASLAEELARQKVMFEQSTIVGQARNELAERGIGLNDENFARCVAEGDDAAVQNFLLMGFSPNTKNARGVPLLSLAVRHRNSNLVRTLIDQGAQVNALAEDRGTSPLMEAAGHGELPYVRLLLERGADLHQQSKTGQNALILAASEGHTEVVAELVKHRPDLKAVDSLGMTALRYAQLFGYAEMAGLIEEVLELDTVADQ